MRMTQDIERVIAVARESVWDGKTSHLTRLEHRWLAVHEEAVSRVTGVLRSTPALVDALRDCMIMLQTFKAFGGIPGATREQEHLELARVLLTAKEALAAVNAYEDAGLSNERVEGVA